MAYMTIETRGVVVIPAAMWAGARIYGLVPLRYISKIERRIIDAEIYDVA
jgi:hypothetical protein